MNIRMRLAIYSAAGYVWYFCLVCMAFAALLSLTACEATQGDSSDWADVGGGTSRIVDPVYGVACYRYSTQSLSCVQVAPRADEVGHGTGGMQDHTSR